MRNLAGSPFESNYGLRAFAVGAVRQHGLTAAPLWIVGLSVLLSLAPFGVGLKIRCEFAAKRIDAMDNDDPHHEIERLEAQIDELAARLASCRKFILVSRIAIVAGAALLVALPLGLIRFDPTVMLAAIAAVLGGIVGWGSNRSTAQEAAAELAALEADRRALIGTMDLHVVTERPTVH